MCLTRVSDRWCSRDLWRGGLLLLQLLLLPRAFALDPNEGVLQYNCRSWTRQSGLSANGISAITQTRDGFIWLGTQKGIVRYDGAEFKTLALPKTKYFQHQGIFSLAPTTEGDLWFGILNGGFGLYGQDSGFSAVTNQPWVTPDMKTSALLQASDGSLWVNSSGGLVRWDRKSGSIQYFNPGNYECLTAFEDSKHRVWFSMLSGGLFYYDGKEVVRFPDPAMSERGTFVFGIAEDLQGQLWFATQSGARVYDSNFHPAKRPTIYPKILQILADREGGVWMGSDGNGLFLYRAGQVSVLRKSDGLADDRVTALYEDREGSLWVGTRGGLSLLTDVKFPIFSPEIPEQAAPGNTTAALHGVCISAGGGIWASANNGLYQFDGKSFVHYDASAGLESPWLKQVFEAKNGDLYLGNGSHDVEIFRDGKVVARHKCQSWTTGFAEDSRSVLVGVGPQLYRVTRDAMTPYEFTNQTPSLGWIRSLNTQRDGTILLATANGIYLVKDGDYGQITTEDGLPVNDALWICEDKEGVLWAGLAGGLARIQGQRVDSWTRENGLFDDFIHAIVPDDNGWLWVQSGDGIFRIKRDSFVLNGVKAKQLNCETFDSMDSVKTLETADVEYSACRTEDGHIWFPSPQGIIMIDPAHLRTNPAPPLVHIEKIRANGGDFHGLALQPGRGDLEVQYTAPTFIAPRKLHFRYKLEGYDSDWVDAGTRRSAFYTNLKPGKYRFLVEALNADNAGGALPAAFEINFPPHFYQTAWFYVVGVGIFFAALGGVYTWRVRHLKSKQHALREANDRLDTKVQRRTAQLADANASLHQRTVALENEVEQRKKMQAEIERAQQQLIEASRHAGMAEVATSVLHNVGNVLNSINISTDVLLERVKKSKVDFVARAGKLMSDHGTDLAAYIAHDSKGRKLPEYLLSLGEELKCEQSDALKELASLEKNVTHVKEIVAAQQSYARFAGVVTSVNIPELIQEALRMTAADHCEIRIAETHDDTLPEITTDRHQVLQILMNLIANAKHACVESGRPDKEVLINSGRVNGHVTICVTDNGIGIPPENLTRIFAPGFTTKKNGHGFGLHGSSLAARQLGGALLVSSDGPKQGASFTLELPVKAVPANHD